MDTDELRQILRTTSIYLNENYLPKDTTVVKARGKLGKGSLEKEEEDRNNVIFDPPVNRLRYAFAAEIIRKNDCRRIADLGCGPMRLFSDYLRHNTQIELCRCVDFDREELERGMKAVTPRTVDYLSQRRVDTNVEILHGDILSAESDVLDDGRLFQLDCVVMIEVIEHVLRPDADRMLSYVLERLQPKILIVTTPNVDFNVLFDDGSQRPQFRHHDHKFELTRAEFTTMVSTAADNNKYSVEITGIGRPLDWRGFDETAIGCCTQAAVFRKLENQAVDSEAGCNCASETDHYKLVAVHTFPRNIQEITDPEALEKEFAYRIRNYCFEFLYRRSCRGYCANDETDDIELDNAIPTELVLKCNDRLSEEFKSPDELNAFIRSLPPNNSYGLSVSSDDGYILYMDEDRLSDSSSQTNYSNNYFEVTDSIENCAKISSLIDNSEIWGDDGGQFSDAD